MIKVRVKISRSKCQFECHSVRGKILPLVALPTIPSSLLAAHMFSLMFPAAFGGTTSFSQSVCRAQTENGGGGGGECNRASCIMRAEIAPLADGGREVEAAS